VTDARSPAYNWPVLALLTFTGTFVAAMPVSCMPALFKEISDDLGLSLVQVGSIWGIASLAGVFVSIIGGVLSDRFGLKRIIVIFCILVGVTGALRGLSNSFFTLMLTVFLNGVVRLVIPVSVTKSVGMWFRGPKLGTAMGISAMGMGLGLTLGPMISASLVSPALGGWRNVMYVYGAVDVVMGLVWYFFGREPPAAPAEAGRPRLAPVGRTLSGLLHMKAVWLLSVGLLFRVACLMGFTGFLPLYLRDQGWEAATADGTLAAFYAMSTLMVVPLSIISDRLHSRKAILLPAAAVTTIAVGLMPLAEGNTVWLLAVAAGFFMDGFMAVIVTMLLETEGIGPAFSGMALGVIFTIAQVGSVVSPPIGNSFASSGAGMPFFFWAGLSLLSVLVLALTRETVRKTVA
jgi:MFS family permease